jgi:hypothetical protein
MNDSNSNSSFSNFTTSKALFTLDEALIVIGSSSLTDSLFLYPNSILGPIGLALSIVCLVVLNKQQFNGIQLYQFFKVSSANSALECFVSTFLFISNSYRPVPWSNTYWTQCFYIYFYIPVMTTSYFYGTALDILITLNCIANFNRVVGRLLSTVKTYKTCLIVFIVCLFINTPSFFQFAINRRVFNFNATADFYIWNTNQPSAISLSPAGTVIILLAYVFRDLVMTVALILLNLISLWYVKRHFLNRLSLFGSSRSTNQVQQQTGDNTLLRSAPFQQQGNNNSKNWQIVINQVVAKSQNNKKMDHRMTLMAVCICTISTFEHLVYMSSVAFPYFSSNLVVFDILFPVANTCVNVKHATYFFILVLFNKNFRKQLVQIFSSTAI